MPGLEARLMPLKDNGFDDAGMLDRVDERTKIIFICNPNNPTGAVSLERRPASKISETPSMGGPVSRQRMRHTVNSLKAMIFRMECH